MFTNNNIISKVINAIIIIMRLIYKPAQDRVNQAIKPQKN